MTSPTTADAVRALARAARVMERACGDLNLAQFRVLAAIAAGDERASRIADRLAVGKPTISATVESLRQRGLLTRGSVAGDQRAAVLRLTDEGRAAYEAVEREMTQRLDWLAARTPDPAAVVRTLASLDAAIDKYLAERGRAATTGRRDPEGGCR